MSRRQVFFLIVWIKYCIYPFDIKYNFVMFSFSCSLLSCASYCRGEKRIYAHTVNLTPLLPKFSVILVNSGTSQYNVEEKFHAFLKLKKHLGFNVTCLTIFNFKSLKRKNTSLYIINICWIQALQSIQLNIWAMLRHFQS